MSKELIMIVAVIVVVFVALVLLWGPAPGAPIQTADGVLIDSSSYKDFKLKGKEEKVNVNLRFQVGPDQVITMTRKQGDVTAVAGQKAKISFKLGRVFGNRVYLGYEWIH